MRKILLLSALVLTGCAATGVRVDQNQMSGFQTGKTSYEDVVAQLGQPTEITRKSDGNTTASYIYSEYQTRPETFIPYVGMFVGGGDTRMNTAMFEFNSKGILIDHSYSESQFGTNTGITAGGTPSRVNTVERN